MTTIYPFRHLAAFAYRALLGGLLLGLASPVAAVAQEAASPTVTHIGRVDHPPIDEMSGIVKSSHEPNLWWVHNDSGDRARLFAIDSTGSIRLSPRMSERYALGSSVDTSEKKVWPGVQLHGASNVDYEEIAMRNDTLYVADIGNNANRRRDLGIYEVPEPHHSTEHVRPMKFIPVAYPDQDRYPPEKRHYDAEGLFVDHGQLYVLTKRRDATGRSIVSGTTLYRLKTERPHRTNMLREVDRHASIPAPTAAARSPGGDQLAVLSYGTVWIFPRPQDSAKWLSTRPRKIDLPAKSVKQSEAVTWDGPHTLRITNEQRDIFVLSLDE